VFLDIAELQSKIGRDPGDRADRADRPPREPRGEPRQHTPQFLQRSTGAPRSPVSTVADDDDFEED